MSVFKGFVCRCIAAIVGLTVILCANRVQAQRKSRDPQDTIQSIHGKKPTVHHTTPASRPNRRSTPSRVTHRMRPSYSGSEKERGTVVVVTEAPQHRMLTDRVPILQTLRA